MFYGPEYGLSWHMFHVNEKNEYSSAVRHIYKDAALVRELTLSEDESVVEGVER